MKKTTKLERSNRAHKRLIKYHRKRSNGENVHFVKMNYHSNVIFQQSKKKRVLSEAEKKAAYDSVIRTFFS